MLAVIISYDDRRAQSVKGMSRASLSVTQPLPAPRSLTGELVARLTDDITSGKIPPGSRLPTEQELIAATGVSRTVVREAVAALRADGLVVTRQGVGAFVPENARRPLRIDVDPLSPLRAVLDVMELRTGIEIEAAGLAAERGSAPQIRRIVDCFDAVGAALKRGDDAIAQDFALHCSIADASSSRGRRFAAGPGSPSAPTAKPSSASTAPSCRRSATAPFCKRAPRCAGISSTVAGAMSGSRPSSAAAS